MAKTFYTNGTGSQQTLTGSQNEKVAIYQTLADAEADLANLEAGQIVATPDTGDENAQPVDVIQAGNMHAVTSNAVATSNAMPVDEVTVNNVHSVTSNAVANAIGVSESVMSTQTLEVIGIKNNTGVYLAFNFKNYSSFVTIDYLSTILFTLPEEWRPLDTIRIMAYMYTGQDRTVLGIDISPEGTAYCYPLSKDIVIGSVLSQGIYGNVFVKIR